MIVSSDSVGNGVDLGNFLVAEPARNFGFAFKNRSAESLGDFRYGLSPRHWIPCDIGTFRTTTVFFLPAGGLGMDLAGWLIML